MRDIAYMLVVDGFADWEASLAAAEINRSGPYTVVTVGLSHEPVRSMGGLRVLPDVSVDEIGWDRLRVLLVPGGTSWEAHENPVITNLLQRVDAAGVPIAALCGATIGLARAGLLRGRKHTSNARGYLASHVPGYGSDDDYVDRPAVRDGNVITASGMGGVEFAFELIELLDLYTAEDRKLWLTIFRDKVVPEQAGQAPPASTGPGSP
jgi:putative intracellular protease/amidase